LVGSAVVLVVTTISALIFVRTRPFGASPSGDRQARIEKSPAVARR